MNIKNRFAMLAAVLTICGATALTSCSANDDPVAPQPSLSEAIIGEWIFEQKVDEIDLENPDITVEPSSSGYVTTVIYHFYAGGSCWKENDVMKEGKMVYQAIDRYSTYESTYTIDATGKLVVMLNDNVEETTTTEIFHFNGTTLTAEGTDVNYPLVRATDAQVKLYKAEADAWHGGAADEKQYDVADYKPKGVDNSQWMKQLNDNRLVCDLSLPGSHDACTAEGWNNQDVCQRFLHYATAMAGSQPNGVLHRDRRPECHQG